MIIWYVDLIEYFYASKTKHLNYNWDGLWQEPAVTWSFLFIVIPKPQIITTLVLHVSFQLISCEVFGWADLYCFFSFLFLFAGVTAYVSG